MNKDDSVEPPLLVARGGLVSGMRDLKEGRIAPSSESPASRLQAFWRTFLPDSPGMSRVRQCALAVSIAWLLLGVFGGIEGFGVAPYVPWRPAAVIVFFGVNALAAGTLIAEFLAAASADFRARRALVLKLAAAAVMLVSVIGYIEFMQVRVVLGT